MPHLRYLKYVVRHKAFVFWAGIQIGGIPIWRLIIHDWSKMTFAEWKPYVNTFYTENKGAPGDFDTAWLHHQHHNPHHWQYWVLREDDGAVKVLEMPKKFAREMVADWMGAGKAITGKWDAAGWYLKNEDKIKLHPKTSLLVENLLFPFGRCEVNNSPS